jgi:hypothetical protein
MDALNYADNGDSTEEEDDDSVCTVCLEKMQDDDSRALACGHRFHLRCITQSYCKQSKPARQCFYCRTAFEEMAYSKTSGKFVRGLHCQQSLADTLKSSTPHEKITWPAMTKGRIVYVHRGKNAMQTARFERVSKGNKTATLLLLQDGRKVQCVCHNLSLLD